MDPCHTRPFVRPGVVIDGAASAPAQAAAPATEACDYCGAASLEWRKCKLICTSCRQINKSCADL
jgi:hypothetical protein